MSDNKNVDNPPEKGRLDVSDANITASESLSSPGNIGSSKKTSKVTSPSERQIKFEKAQRCLENAALVSKRIKEHRKATAELLGRPFDDDGGDTASEMASTMSERTGFSTATDVSTTLSVQDALNIPGISESLANTLKQKELLMERIKQYKEISKRPAKKPVVVSRRESVSSVTDSKVEFKKPRDIEDTSKLQSLIQEKENALSIMQVKMRAMETTIMDLQEKISEKDQVIEAKTKASTIISDSLSKKEKDSMTLLEDTRQQMTKMQENFIAMESEWKLEKEKLLKEIEFKDNKISSLEEASKILENTRFDLSVAQSKLVEELEAKTELISELENKIESLKAIDDIDRSLPIDTNKENEEGKEKGSIEIENMVELTKRIELLEQLNCQIRQTNKELEHKLAAQPSESKATSSPVKAKSSPLPTRKGRNTASKSKSPWSQIQEPAPESDKKNKIEPIKQEAVIQSLNKDILDKEYVISQKDELVNELKAEIEKKMATIKELEEKLLKAPEEVIETPKCDMKDTGINTEFIPEAPESLIDLDNLTVDELKEKVKSAEDRIVKLNKEIDTANKNMIKVKSNSKTKLKQLQKTIDNIGKVTDANSEIVRLNEEVHQLTQKVAELEEEKGNLQLHLVDYDSGRLTESDLYKKMVEMEKLAESRLNVITTLETQKFDLVQELHVLQQKNVEMEDRLADMTQLESEQVCSEMKSVQLEEQIDQLTTAKKELEQVIDNLKHEIEELNKTIKLLHEEKDDIMHKLEHYIQENMDLTDKLEKLSAEKVSSAESIEIVESLTTQEKLELEEYNKGLIDSKAPTNEDNTQRTKDNLEQLIIESEELNRRIELFTQERQEVMEKMSKLTTDNDELKDKIKEMYSQAENLQSTVELLNQEKAQLQILNQTLNQQIEEIHGHKMDIMKESVESTQSVEEIGHMQEPAQDEKAADKGINRNKSVKQLTKEILKLKNIIKEREAEICDCQMKILSLEEQEQKHSELLKNYEKSQSILDSLSDENKKMKEELSKVDLTPSADHSKLEETNHTLQQEINNLRQEYYNTINIKDSKIKELEKLLSDYEQQINNFGCTLQQKDKELNEYINQVTKINDVSQKLKSTIELLEEEKARDAEQVKSLNKQIAVSQKKLAELNEKLVQLEEERNTFDSKNKNLDLELKESQNKLAENTIIIKELQEHKNKYISEANEYEQQAKEKDEEIHEIKLQLRKESIEKEKLRNMLEDKMKTFDSFSKENNDLKEKYNVIVNEIEEMKSNWNALLTEKESINNQFTALESKQRDTMEKLKKYAATLKKRNQLYAELETKLAETEKALLAKSQEMEQWSIQLNIIPSLQEKLKYAEEEVNRLHSIRSELESQKVSNMSQLNEENTQLKQQITTAHNEIMRLNEAISSMNNELQKYSDDNQNLRNQKDLLNKKLVEYEIEQKNSINFFTKINSLESDISQKQALIDELQSKLDNHEQNMNQVQFGYGAKIQERDLYIENLESEMNTYKNRIYRLEESVSVMEGRRCSLERKADQLDSQLLEKQKAYSEYIDQEDELVNRLSVLMDHDRVLENKLHELENENKELQNRIQELNNNNQYLKNSLTYIEEQCNNLKERASQADVAENNAATSQNKIKELEAHLQKLTSEHRSYVAKSKYDFEELEAESNAQIETAIKEKKMLTEKCEKLNEHIQHLEQKLQEYHSHIQTMKINIEEISKLNQQLMENKQTDKPDYTEQYINEINKLNAVINSKNQEIHNIQNQHLAVQSNAQSSATVWESKIAELNNTIAITSQKIDALTNENTDMKSNIEELQNLLQQKEVFIEELEQKKTVMFEMNIPKTEGMIISSTVELMKEDPKTIEDSMVALEDQIITDTNQPILEPNKTSEHIQTQTEGVEEPKIVAKKAYLCYKGDESSTLNIEEADPFNSDEGWGLGETTESEIIMPAFTELNNQLAEAKIKNEGLESELASVHLKFTKAMKRLKELKSTNEMLTKELKTAKQLQSSQSSFLDSAIEDELKINIQELEKKILDLNTDLNKNKTEIESLRKQNDVLNSANEKLVEMKEKMDNEIELWKFKFKESNDKMSNFQWGGETQQSNVSVTHSTDEKLKEDIFKLEKENDELQAMLDQVTAHNKQREATIDALNVQIEQLAINKQNDKVISLLNDKINAIENLNKELIDKDSALNKELQLVEEASIEISNKYSVLEQINLDVTKKYQQLHLDHDETVRKYQELEQNLSDLKSQYQQLENTNNDTIINKYNTLKQEYEKILSSSEEKIKILEEKCRQLNDEASSHKLQLDVCNENLRTLSTELEEAKSKIIMFEQQSSTIQNTSQSFMMAEKFNTIDDQHSQHSTDLKQAHGQIVILKNREQELLKQIKQNEEKLTEAYNKITQLNSENDQLLSTVTELRSSISSAMDQRGFEIAELWKQHLSQREAEFQKVEQDLRTQLHSYETKYEQLLDSIQSSSQEETNKLVMVEQINSLQTKIQDKDEHLNALQSKYAEAVNQLEMLRSELDDEKAMQENKLLNQLDEYEKTIKELNNSVNQLEEEQIAIKQDLGTTKEINAQLNIKIEDLNGVIKDLEENTLELTNELREKDMEVHHKTQDLTISLNHRNEEFENVRKELLVYEKKIEDLSYEKEAELAVIRLKMHENKDYYEKILQGHQDETTHLTEALNDKIIECTNLNRQITDLNNSLQEYELKSKETQAVLENQELDIVTLNEEIENLKQILRNSSKMSKHVSFSVDTKPGDLDPNETQRELLDLVPKAEVDLAMYMLHQRDVRCEELTMELTQLLEERDTLQIRLSDSLRSLEELKNQCKLQGFNISLSSIPESGPESVAADKEVGTVDVHRAGSRSSSISDPDGDKPHLQAKLTELRSVKHSRDVTLRHDSQQRELSMRLLHRDVANLPPEAVEQLQQAHHTLARDSQSTPTVLLNWLRGKSTPKVVHM